MLITLLIIDYIIFTPVFAAPGDFGILHFFKGLLLHFLAEAGFVLFFDNQTKCVL